MHNDFPIFAWVKDRYFEAESFLFAFTYRYSVRRREYLWGADGNKFLIRMNTRRQILGQVDRPYEVPPPANTSLCLAAPRNPSGSIKVSSVVLARRP